MWFLNFLTALLCNCNNDKGRNENFYQQAFTYLTDRLKRIIFVDMHDMDSEAKVNFRKVAEIATNQHISTFCIYQVSSVYKHPH